MRILHLDWPTPARTRLDEAFRLMKAEVDYQGVRAGSNWTDIDAILRGAARRGSIQASDLIVLSFPPMGPPTGDDAALIRQQIRYAMRGLRRCGAAQPMVVIGPSPGSVDEEVKFLQQAADFIRWQRPGAEKETSNPVLLAAQLTALAKAQTVPRPLPSLAEREHKALGPLCYYPGTDTGELPFFTLAGKRVPLVPAEVIVLREVFLQQGEMRSKKHILAALANVGGDVPQSNPINVHMSRIRRALRESMAAAGCDVNDPDTRDALVALGLSSSTKKEEYFIQLVWSEGYRLNVEALKAFDRYLAGDSAAATRPISATAPVSPPVAPPMK